MQYANHLVTEYVISLECVVFNFSVVIGIL